MKVELNPASQRMVGKGEYFLAECTNGTVFMWNSRGQACLPVIVATRGIRGAAAQTIAHIWNVAWTLNREPILCQYGGHGYAFVRSMNFKRFQEDIGGLPATRGILLDDDILLPRSESLMDALFVADKYGWNFVAPYRVTDGHVVIAHKDGALMTVEEYEKLDPWQKVERAGLGWYYGDIPLNYTFHEQEPHGGEDLNFFYDNPALDVRLCDLDLIHLKEYGFGMKTKMEVKPRQKPTPRFPTDGLPMKISPAILERVENGAHD